MNQDPGAGRREGHPLSIREVDIDALDARSDVVGRIYGAEQTGVVVRRALPEALVEAGVAQLGGDALAREWSSPNAGMSGGEIRVIGDAATPTFTAMRGPSVERYGASAARHAAQTRAVFGEGARPTDHIERVLGSLFAGRPARPPVFDDDTTWAPYGFRALDPGEQIYAHHDNHYGLGVYERMDPALDRTTLLSWFLTLQAPERGGQLIVYSLWGSDPDPPMLPTRFLDTEALERRFDKHVFDLHPGDLVVFDAGRHVHRVSPVEGARPRLTMGGFMTPDIARTRLAYWS